jgi:hypothetical protein
MPTFAELAMLGDMQNDNNSAIKNLFVPSGTTSGWWTAQNQYSIKAQDYTYENENGVDGTANHSAAVRCVRDTWKDYPQDHYGVYGVFRDN